MPGGDRTGPQGNGPMTGRGGGYCMGSGESAGGRLGVGRLGGWRFALGAGRFLGRRLSGGWGRGRRNRFLGISDPARAWRRRSMQSVAAPSDRREK